MADVFISYSRQGDTPFVDRLAAALEARGQAVWVDREDIFPSSQWRPEIDQAILEAHTFVFVVSPESVVSPYCRAELDRALALGKRTVPILARQTPIDLVPPELAALHFLPFTDGEVDGDGEGEGFEQRVDRLVEVLSTDIDAIHLHTRLLSQATRWAERQQDRSVLLRGKDLDEAEHWLDQQTATGRPVLTEQQRLIRESRRSATRRQRGFAGVALAVAVVTVLLAAAALVQRTQAVHQANLAKSRDLAAESTVASSSNVEIQDLLSLGAYARSPTISARSATVSAVEEPLETILRPAAGPIEKVAYDPAGHLLAVGCQFGVVLWNTTTDTMDGRVFDARQEVNSIAFSPDGRQLAVAEHSGFTALFDVSNRSFVRQLRADGAPVNDVAFSPNGRALAAVTNDGALYLWNLTSRAAPEHTSLGSNSALFSVAFSRDGSLLAVAGAVAPPNRNPNGVVKIFPLSGQPARTFNAAGSEIPALAFSPSGSTLAASDANGDVIFLNPTNARQTGELRVGAYVGGIAFNASGTLLATGDAQGAVRLWLVSSIDQPSGATEVGGPMENGSIVFGLAFSPDGRSLASGGYGGNLVLWTTTAHSPLTSTITADSGIQSLSISSNSTFLATANRNFTVDIWNLRTRRGPVHLTESSPLTSVAFDTHAATTLAIGEQSGDVLLYDVVSRRSVTLPQTGSGVEVLAFSPQGTTLAVGHRDGVVSLWSLATRKIVGPFLFPGANPGGVAAIAFSPSGHNLAVSDNNAGTAVFDPASPRSPGRPVATSELSFSLAFSGNGSVLAAGDNAGNVELFDATNLERSGTLPGDGNPIFGMALTPDGRTLATVDGAGDLHLWDLATHQALGSPQSTGSATFVLAFAPDNLLLATGDQAGGILLWPSLLWSTDRQAFSHDLCPRLGGNLTRAEWNQYAPGESDRAICPGYPDG